MLQMHYVIYNKIGWTISLTKQIACMGWMWGCGHGWWVLPMQVWGKWDISFAWGEI